VAIERSAFSDPWSASDFSECIAARVPLLVAVDEAAIAGYVVARAVADEGEILNLAVAARYQRRGVGRDLVRAGLALLAASGARTVYLEVRESNDAARRLYEGLGFEILARRRDYYRRPVEAALVLRAAIIADRVDA
jgi:[ribosomal protein S18]-alanine N-acetyltransferase